MTVAISRTELGERFHLTTPEGTTELAPSFAGLLAPYMPRCGESVLVDPDQPVDLDRRLREQRRSRSVVVAAKVA